MNDLTGDPLTFRAPEFRFGDGISGDLPEALDRLGVDAPLVVSDPGVRDAGIVAGVTDGVDQHHAFDAATEPSTEDFRDIPKINVDGVVAVGSGSCLDAAKVVALLLEPGLQYNYPVRGDAYGEVAGHLSVGDTADHLLADIRLRDTIDLPDSFAALGLDASDAEEIVEATLVQERRLVTNPRDVRNDLVDIVTTAFDDA